MLILLGVAVIVVGFAIRLNPLLVVVLAALTSGWFAGLSPLQVIAAFGKAFNANRFVSTAYLVLPLVGVLERAGLRERAAKIISGLRGVSVGRLLIGYMVFRQATTAVGLMPRPIRCVEISVLISSNRAALKSTRSILLTTTATCLMPSKCKR